jgi:hypothetical protein
MYQHFMTINLLIFSSFFLLDGLFSILYIFQTLVGLARRFCHLRTYSAGPHSQEYDNAMLQFFICLEEIRRFKTKTIEKKRKVPI